MVAGASAGESAELALQRARALEEQAAAQRALAGRMTVANETELRTSQLLSRLSPFGYVQLTDRRWPGSSRANVDLVLVGPSGVYVVDTKCWADVSIDRGRIFRGQDDVTDELDGLRRLADLTRIELADVGLAPAEVVTVVVLAGVSGVHEQLAGIQVVGERDLLRFVAGRGERLREHQVDQILARCLTLFPAMDAPARDVPRPRGATVTVPAPAPPEPDQLALIDEVNLKQALREAAMAQPIEDWMTFLHPEQAKHVQRSFSGPARVRGAAGTGKTVVGLHRAAYLAQTRPGRVLYTSFVRTLPRVLEEHYRRLSPQTVDRVDFVGIHKFAGDLLRSRGYAVRLDGRTKDRAYESAWAQIGRGVLKEVPQDRRYWRDEIDWVIKGRGLTRFDDYARLSRIGRRFPLTVDQREQVWRLYIAYQKQLQQLGVHDFNDVLIKAEQELGTTPHAADYHVVVVDEVQDLTCVAVRLLHHLVGDRPDGLLLIGDGQQSVYPGGFTLAEAGVDVRGRSSVLRHNYRNTAEILQTAQQVVAADAFSDLDELDEAGQRDVVVMRNGPHPVRVDASDLASHDQALLSALAAARAKVGVGLGDIAILAASGKVIDECATLLSRQRIPYVHLEDYDGKPTDRVKLGTFHRAKGLEFKHVLLPRLSDAPRRMRRGDSEADHRDWLELERRQLFVGMTRARDGLWLGYLTTECRTPAAHSRRPPS